MTNEEKVRAAQNPSTLPEILGALSRDKDWSVRQIVAGNPSTPLELLLILMCDDDEESVRQKTEATLSKRVQNTHQSG